MSNRMKARAIRDLRYSWYLKILSNCIRLKAREILREFSNITRSVNPWLLTALAFIRLPIQIEPCTSVQLPCHNFSVQRSFVLNFVLKPRMPFSTPACCQALKITKELNLGWKKKTLKRMIESPFVSVRCCNYLTTNRLNRTRTLYLHWKRNRILERNTVSKRSSFTSIILMQSRGNTATTNEVWV